MSRHLTTSSSHPKHQVPVHTEVGALHGDGGVQGLTVIHSGPIKRAAAPAVGEGSTAVRQVHDHLARQLT